MKYAHTSARATRIAHVPTSRRCQTAHSLRCASRRSLELATSRATAFVCAAAPDTPCTAFGAVKRADSGGPRGERGGGGDHIWP